MRWFRAAAPPDANGLRLQLLPASISNGAFVITDYEAFKLVVVRASAHGPLPVSRADLATLGLTPSQAFKIAAAATWAHELVKLDVRQYDLGTGHMTAAAVDDCPYVSVALLGMNAWASPPPAFVCAPKFSTVAVLQLTSRADLDVVEGMRSICRSMSEDADDPCDPEVYWFDGQIFRKPQYAAPVGDGAPVPVTPSSLVKLLATLPER